MKTDRNVMPPLAGAAFGKELESHLWHSLVITAVDAIVVIDDQGRVMSFNPAAEAMFGVSADEIVGMNVSLLVPHTHAGQHDQYLSRYRNTGIAHFIGKRREVMARRADGAEFPVELAVSEVKIGDRRVFMGTFHDITERRRTLEQLEISERRLADAQRLAKLGHWDWNILTNELHWSDEIYRIFGVGVREFEATYPAFLERVHPEDRAIVESAVARAVAGEAPYSVDHRIVWPNGEIRCVYETGEVTVENGRPVHMLGTVQDITDRKRAEQLVQAALDEKEVLLREVHHRVKNNLQVIAGILTLQMSLVKDQATADVLRSTEQRVRAMALVHERLYASNDMESVDLAVYLNELLDRISVTLVRSPADVRIEKAFESITVDLDTAMPCGLIMSELMTNGLKYGLVQGRGTLTAGLRRVGNRAELHFHDAGPGVSGEIDLPNSPGLGLRLVHILSKQLRGELEIRSGPGLSFTLTWPLKELA